MRKSAAAKKSAVKRVLLVDDDPALRAMLSQQVAVNGEFVATEAETLAEAQSLLLGRHRFRLVVIDVILPDGDGRDFCARLRQRGFRFPIILLTGSDQESDVVRGLDSGANDYIAKPFRLAELLARMRAQIRIYEEASVRKVQARTPNKKMLSSPTAGKRARPRDLLLKALNKLEATLRVVNPPSARRHTNRSREANDWVPLRSADREEALSAITNIRKELAKYDPDSTIMEAGRILFSSFSMKLSKWFRKEINVSADTAARAVGLATAAKLIEWVNDARLDLNAVIESISRWLTSGIM